MKTIKTILATLAMTMTAVTANAQFNLSSLLSSAGQALQNATSTTKFEAKDLVGTWKYSSPGVNFKGQDAMSQIGGAAISTTLENSLASYYTKAGMQKLVFTVDDDYNFTFTLDKIKITGKISKAKDGDLVFKFNAFDKINLGQVSCIATKSGNLLNLTFDASRLLKIAKGISSISKDEKFSTISQLLDNYDGLYLGVKLNREK